MITHSENQVKSKLTVDFDFKLQEEFQLGVLKFENNPLHQKLKSDVEVRENLAFVPNMLFFVMGFKDLMEIVRYDNPTSELEKSVNTHSDEDSNHWQWYLDDLAFISGKFKNTDSINLIANVWDSATLETRKTIYAFSRHIQNAENPVARMLMIEVLELTFDKFKEALHPLLKASDLYDQLDYFGKKHQDTEENHSTGISDDEISGLISLLPEELKEPMIPVINQLFDQMYKMAKNWSEA
ncbi:MAG: hypothetical protein AB8B73_05810 [Ekhidna sp.]